MSAGIDFMQKALAYTGFNKPDGFNAYGLGGKFYNSGRGMPNIGASGPAGRMGYDERDQRIRAQKQALMERMQAGSAGNFGSAAFMRGL